MSGASHVNRKKFISFNWLDETKIFNFPCDYRLPTCVFIPQRGRRESGGRTLQQTLFPQAVLCVFSSESAADIGLIMQTFKYQPWLKTLSGLWTLFCLCFVCYTSHYSICAGAEDSQLFLFSLLLLLTDCPLCAGTDEICMHLRLDYTHRLWEPGPLWSSFTLWAWNCRIFLF